MFKNLLQIYALVSCFLATTIMMIASVFFLNSLTDLTIPQYAFYSSLSRFESNENFIFYFKKDRDLGDNKEVQELNKLSPTALSEKRIQEKEKFLEDKRRGAIESLIRCLQWMVISSLFFYLHRRLYKKSVRDL